jgi:hypothetical protein
MHGQGTAEDATGSAEHGQVAVPKEIYCGDILSHKATEIRLALRFKAY